MLFIFHLTAPCFPPPPPPACQQLGQSCRSSRCCEGLICTPFIKICLGLPPTTTKTTSTTTTTTKTTTSTTTTTTTTTTAPQTTTTTTESSCKNVAQSCQSENCCDGLTCAPFINVCIISVPLGRKKRSKGDMCGPCRTGGQEISLPPWNKACIFPGAACPTCCVDVCK